MVVILMEIDEMKLVVVDYVKEEMFEQDEEELPESGPVFEARELIECYAKLPS